MDFDSRCTLLELFAEITSCAEQCLSFEGIPLPQVGTEPPPALGLWGVRGQEGWEWGQGWCPCPGREGSWGWAGEQGWMWGEWHRSWAWGEVGTVQRHLESLVCEQGGERGLRGLCCSQLARSSQEPAWE